MTSPGCSACHCVTLATGSPLGNVRVTLCLPRGVVLRSRQGNVSESSEKCLAHRQLSACDGITSSVGPVTVVLNVVGKPEPGRASGGFASGPLPTRDPLDVSSF